MIKDFKKFEQSSNEDWTITVKGDSGAVVVDTGGDDYDDYDGDLSKLDGLGCDDEFSEYFPYNSTLKGVVDNGYMNFKLEGGKLFTITTYDSIRRLTDEELKKLCDYTQGQWSDGIGEGFEQHPCMVIGGKEIFISPWHVSQKIEISQNKN